MPENVSSQNQLQVIPKKPFTTFEFGGEEFETHTVNDCMFVLSDKDWQELGLNKAEMVIDGMD